MENDIQQIVDLVNSAAGMKAMGALAVAGGGLTGAVRLLKLSLIQRLFGSIPKIGPYLQWDNLDSPGRMLFVFAMSAGGAALTSMSTGISFSSALAAGALIGLKAMGMHETTVNTVSLVKKKEEPK